MREGNILNMFIISRAAEGFSYPATRYPFKYGYSLKEMQVGVVCGRGGGLTLRPLHFT